jgi:hypothetical protein
MTATYVGVFYVGVTTAQRTASTAQKLVVTTTSSVSTFATVHRIGALSTTGLEIELGGMMLPTSLQDPNVSVQVFDAKFVGAESESDALVKKAQALFEDPEPFVASGEIDADYRASLLKFKAGITHCAISLMRIRAS